MMVCLRRMGWVCRITAPVSCRLRNQSETKLSFLSRAAAAEEMEGVELGALTPSCTRADVDPGYAQKLDLCASEGFDHLYMKKLLSPQHSFCNCPFSRLASIIALLKRKHISGKHAALVLSGSPLIFKYRPQHLDKKLTFLEELGLQTPQIIKLFLHRCGTSSILGLSVHNMQKHVDLLHDIGINKGCIPKVLSSYPILLSLNIENNIKPTLEFLTNKGMTKESLSKLLLLRPSVLGYSLDEGLTQKLALVQHMGFDIDSKSGLRALKSWCTCSNARTLANLEFLKSQGFSHDDACKMVHKHPSILNLKQESVQQKLDYLKNVLNRDIQEVVKCSAYLTFSLKDRIAPRFTMLKNCNFCLSYVLSISNQAFEKRFSKYQRERGNPCAKMEGQVLQLLA